MALTAEKRALLDQYYAKPAAPATAPEEKGFLTRLGEGMARGAKQRALGVGQLLADTTAGKALESALRITDPEVPGTQLKATDLMGGLDRQVADDLRSQGKGTGAGGFVGEVLGDPLTYLPIPGGKMGLSGLAAMGGVYGVGSGATTPLGEGDSRGTNMLMQGLGGAVLSPVFAKAGDFMGDGINALTRQFLPDNVPVTSVSDNVVASAMMPNSGLAQDTTINIASGIGPDDLQKAIASAGTDAGQGFIPREMANLPPEQASRAALFLRNKVPYSAGDITQDVSQQGIEDLALKGAYGPEAQAMATTFREGQQGALQEAADRTLATIGKGTPRATNEADIATAIQQGLRNTSDTEWAAVNKAYHKVQKSGTAAVPVRAFAPLKDTIKQIKLDYPVETLPKANAAISRIDDFFSKYKGDNAALNYKHVDNFRKFLGNSLSSSQDDAERAVLGKLRGAMDGIVDDAVEQGLIRGNPETMTALKSARGTAKDYFSRFEDNKIIDTIIRKDMTPESIISLILGYGKLGGKKEAATTIGNIKNLLGDASPEFQQIKQAGLLRILGTDMQALAKEGLSGIKPASNLDDVIRSNKSLWTTLYTPEEQGMITELAKLIKDATVKQPGAVNYSGTTPALLRFVNSFLGKFGFAGNITASGINKIAGGAQKSSAMSNIENAFAGKVRGTLAEQPSLAQSLSRAIGERAGQATGAQVGKEFDTPAAKTPITGLTPEKRRLIEQYYKNQGGADASSPAPADTAPFSPPAPVMQESPQSSIMPEIQKAAEISGIDAEFLNKIASRESSLNPDATNTDSTATGLFQITNKTWRGLVKKYGKEYGIGYSDRKNPEANAIMAGLLTKENTARLAKRIGYAPSEPEIYMAHFLGDYAASKLIKNKSSTNAASALFPDAARVNRTVFYHNNGKGKPLTAAELYNKLAYSIS